MFDGSSPEYNIELMERYNLPYNLSLSTGLGQHFLELIDKHFIRKNTVTKISNRNTLRIGYSCVKNMKAILVIQNHKN